MQARVSGGFADFAHELAAIERLRGIEPARRFFGILFDHDAPVEPLLLNLELTGSRALVTPEFRRTRAERREPPQHTDQNEAQQQELLPQQAAQEIGSDRADHSEIV